MTIIQSEAHLDNCRIVSELCWLSLLSRELGVVRYWWRLSNMFENLWTQHYLSVWKNKLKCLNLCSSKISNRYILIKITQNLVKPKLRSIKYVNVCMYHLNRAECSIMMIHTNIVRTNVILTAFISEYTGSLLQERMHIVFRTIEHKSLVFELISSPLNIGTCMYRKIRKIRLMYTYTDLLMVSK